MAHVPFYLDLGTGGGMLLVAVLLIVGGLIAAIEVFCDWRDEQQRRHRQFLIEVAKAEALRKGFEESPFEWYRDTDGYLRVEEMPPCEQARFYSEDNA